ncbi:MAG: LysM peptidoglycan-binding domain-containing M23 family metallopeptidase [Pseudomonadota bacterium]
MVLHRSEHALGALLLLLALGACPRRVPPPEPAAREPAVPAATEALGVFHELKAGETLWGLASRYHVDVDELIEVNGIRDPRDLKVGRLIFIPDLDPMAPLPPPTAGSDPAPREMSEPSSAVATRGTLRWPVDEGVLYSGFGLRQGVRHDGIDLGAPEGAPVRAAADADVLYVGSDRAFGHLVILQHSGGLVTVYAHNRDVVVKMGQHVKVGELIAHLGKSGRSEGPHLHFEVRRGRQPLDPLDFLPDD